MRKRNPLTSLRSGRRPATHDEVWSSLGASDADWGVLTVRAKRHGGWDADLDDFYASGRDTVTACLAAAEPNRRGRALDYGAGTGRLSFALAEVFDEVTCIDVSPGMLATITERAADRGLTNLTLGTPDHMGEAGLHDFALSLLVLQHLANIEAIAEAIGLIAESLRPGAPALIELPETVKKIAARVQPRWQAYRLLRGIGVSPGRLHQLGLSGISMVAVSRRRAETIFADHDLEVVRRIERPDSDYDYVRWVVRRRDGK